MTLSPQQWRREDEDTGSPERSKPAAVPEAWDTVKEETLSPGHGCRCGTVPAPEVWKGPEGRSQLLEVDWGGGWGCLTNPAHSPHLFIELTDVNR